MTTLHYPNSTIPREELRNVLPFLNLCTYNVKDNSSDRGYGIFRMKPAVSDYVKRNMYGGGQSERVKIAEEHSKYIKKLHSRIDELKKHHTGMRLVVDNIGRDADKLDYVTNLKLHITLEKLICQYQRAQFSPEELAEERERVFNRVDSEVLSDLVLYLGLDAEIVTDNDDEEVYQQNLRAISDALLPSAPHNANVLKRSKPSEWEDEKFDSDSDINLEELYRSILNNISTMIEYYKSVRIMKEDNEAEKRMAKKLGFVYFNSDELKYYDSPPDQNSYVYRKSNVDLDTITPSHSDIALLNIIHGVIVRYKMIEYEVEEDYGVQSIRVEYVKSNKTFNEGSMPTAMFREVDKRTYDFMGGMTYGTTKLSYAVSQGNSVIGPVGTKPVYGIDEFEFVGELSNVEYLFNIRSIRERVSVTADVYEGSSYSLPDTTMGQYRSDDKSLRNAYTGSMDKYLDHSSKVSPRARGKLYCIFYMYGDVPVAADENNIYILTEESYNTNAKLKAFKSGENNTYLIPDAYTLNALRYIIALSKIDFSMYDRTRGQGGGPKFGYLHTASTFLTVAVIRPCDLFYEMDRTIGPDNQRDPQPVYNVKVVKSNIYPNLRIQKVVNHSITKKPDDVERVFFYDYPVWPEHFSFNNTNYNNRKRVLEVFDYDRMSCIAYCNNNEYNLEILTGDSLHVDDVIANMKKLSRDGFLKWNGYTTTLERNQIESFREYVSSNYGGYLFNRIIHPEPYPQIANKEFLIMQKRREICYTAYRAIVQNRQSRNPFYDFNTVMANYVPNNNYIPFERVERVEQPPTKNKHWSIKYPVGRNEILNIDINMTSFEKVAPDPKKPDHFVHRIHGIPITKNVNGKRLMSISREVSLRNDKLAKYNRIISQMISSNVEQDALSFRDPGSDLTEQLIDSHLVKEIPERVKSNVIFHILLGNNHTIDETEEYLKDFRSMVRNYNIELNKREEDIFEQIRKRDSQKEKREDILNGEDIKGRSQIGNIELKIKSIDEVINGLERKHPFTEARITTSQYLIVTPSLPNITIEDKLKKEKYVIPFKHSIDKDIESKLIDERDDSYQYAFGWVDAPFINLFLERIGAQDLGFLLYKYTMNRNLEMKNLGTYIHETCKKPILSSSVDRILEVLSLKKQGLRIRHEDTILHTSRSIGFKLFTDKRDDIKFIKPEKVVVAEKKVDKSNIVVIELSDSDDE